MYTLLAAITLSAGLHCSEAGRTAEAYDLPHPERATAACREQASFARALELADLCPDTGWTEKRDHGMWFAVCGDEAGQPIRVTARSLEQGPYGHLVRTWEPLAR